MLKNKKNFNLVNAHQRFSIRKLSVGVTSVLLGLAFVGVNNNSVKAASESAPEEKASLVQEQKQTATADASKVETTSDVTTKQEVTPASNEQKEASTTSEKQTLAEAQNEALIPSPTNTKQSNLINGKGNDAKLTNVPADTIEYDYSISVGNKKTDKTSSVAIGAPGHENSAVINAQNAKDIQLHLSLTNITDQDQFIGNSEWGTNTNPNKFNDDEAQLYLNAWKYDDHNEASLRVDALKPGNVEFMKDGQVINDNALPVYYCRKDNNQEHWYTYDEMKQNFGSDSIYYVTKIGFKGIIPAHVTALMNVPVVVILRLLIQEMKLILCL
ncbi:YSIRK-type signal peptide-containing protein [Lactobacillus xujianguonis]|uniref:YSIRK-type signal peptide-containing protein n=1 Tax=Lactobacillus xujianguonis TaxID=2495899 RepID=UPI00143CE4B5|nr:YSIRK-type signal peptide-containing protein [Lactobacillus xujianguonis]